MAKGMSVLSLDAEDTSLAITQLRLLDDLRPPLKELRLEEPPIDDAILELPGAAVDGFTRP